MSFYTGTFLLGALWFGVPFPKLQTFSGRFCVLFIDYSLYEKTTSGILVYLLICEVTTTKVNFRFYKQYSKTETRLVCKLPIFPQNASIAF